MSSSQAATDPEIVFLDPEEVEIVDGNSPPPHGQPCEACGAPVEEADRFCSACGKLHENVAPPLASSPPTLVRNEPPADDQLRRFRCNGCGAEVAMDANHRSYVCAFCDSTYVVEFSRDVSLRKAPEFVIGFALTLDDAQAKYRKWIQQGGWTTPSDLGSKASAERQRGVYLPFWSFSMLAQSNWEAEIGEYWYRTETYRTFQNGKWVTKTRRVRKTEWWPLAGKHHRFYSAYMVSGSRGLPQGLAEAIKPFHLPALKRYEPFYLAGWLCEEYSVSPDEALQRSQKEFYRRERSNVGAFMPGDTHQDLDVDSYFSHINSDLCLLPIYILTYHYKGKLYRFVVNGQTGRYWGEKPRTYRKVVTALAIAAGLIAAFAAIVMLILALTGSFQ